MAPSPLEQSYTLLIKFLMMSKRRLMELGAEQGLTGMQALVLFLLDEPRPMYSFRKVLNCDASNVTGLIDGLEDKHLAARYTDPADRRVKMVKLSAKGQNLRRELLNHTARRSGSILSRLEPEELETFTALLMKITNETDVLVVK